MTETGVITGVSVAHTHASIDEIDAAGEESERGIVSDLLARPNVEEAFAIHTCNRAEAYVVTNHAADGREALSSFAPTVREGAVRHLEHEAAIRHLMRVAAGLESIVLGEDQIIGQVREAFESARAAGGIGPVLEDAVTKAIHVGERARTETAINEGVVSLGSAAVDLAAEELDLDGASALVVGAGEMSTLAARALEETGVSRICVANRTVSRAREIVSDLDVAAEARSIDALEEPLGDADLVVTATGSPDPVLEPDLLSGTDELVCVDIARPRDVDPAAGELDGIELYDIDALESVTERTRERRRAEAREVEAMIDEEFDRLMESFKRKRADDAIAAMYESADRVKARELDRAVSKLEAQGGLTDDQRETLEALADSLVGQLLAAPTKSLRQAAGEDDWTTIHTALELFDPEFDAPPSTPDDATRSPRGPEGSDSGSEDAVPEKPSE